MHDRLGKLVTWPYFDIYFTIYSSEMFTLEEMMMTRLFSSGDETEIMLIIKMRENSFSRTYKSFKFDSNVVFFSSTLGYKCKR